MEANNYKTFFENTIIDNIDFEGYDMPITGVSMVGDYKTYLDIVDVYEIFKQEYGFMIERVGEVNAFKEWLQGLPSVLTVPFYNYDIINNAREAGLLTATSDDWFKEKDEDSFLDRYWIRLSEAFFNLKDNL
jgi:hypothetical protein